MTETEKKQAAAEFAKKWKDRGDEKSDTHPFWIELLTKIYEAPIDAIEFEKRVKVDGSTKFIDGYIPETKVLIEQKSIDVDLDHAAMQSDKVALTPDKQAARYAEKLNYDETPRWIITSNFKEIRVYDRNKRHEGPEIIKLKDLPKEYYRLEFLVNKEDVTAKKELEVSIQAGEIVGQLYDALLDQYTDKTSPETLKSLNMLCVRLVFCFYAEDAGIFGEREMFANYMKDIHPARARKALIDLFHVLDTKPEDRDPYLEPDLAAFPYVNGGLFEDENIEIPLLNERIMQIILRDASENFDWSAISPTIFGAVFESTLNPETRRSGGMHYTSIQNIRKAIDPLFLNDLKLEYETIESIQIKGSRDKKLRQFQDKLASLHFLDPACGSGNFLTETYLCLRRLENKILVLLNENQEMMRKSGATQIYQVTFGSNISNPIKVSIEQFSGIEINDFAVTVARTALWIAESQMMKETEAIVRMELDFLPLKTIAHIVEGNALKINWNDVADRNILNYIMGNPPFVGASRMTKEQKNEAVAVFGKIKLSNSIDYVGAWYCKAAEFMQNTKIETAFVSTNSITQGEQVAPLWGKLVKTYHVHIDFAYRTFIWNSEAKDKAAVHCVIIGFSVEPTSKTKRIYYPNNVIKTAKNINSYLVDAPDVLIASRSKPICNVPKLTKGNQPSDGGNLIIQTDDELNKILKSEPDLKRFVRDYVGSDEFINKKKRHCFWLKDATPSEIKGSKELSSRVRAVKLMRENSTAAPTRKKAETPHLFFFQPQPDDYYLMIPRVSSKRRRYIPIGFMPPEIIASDSCSIVPKADLYHFGVLTSNVHMAWMRTVTGRLKSDYRYSGGIVYNNFPWPSLTPQQKKEIEKTAQAILEARALYPDDSLAVLYDKDFMPKKLRDAHNANNRAVMDAYGFNHKMPESECVAELMKMYEEKTRDH